MSHNGRRYPDAAVARDVLTALPEPVYRGLASPRETIASCLAVVSEAIESRNPSRIREWINRERETPSDQALRACLDAVLLRVTREGETERHSVLFCDQVRREAKTYFESIAQNDAARAAIDDGAFVAAEGLLSGLRLHNVDLAGHSETTGNFAKRLALHIGCEPDVVARAELAGRLHELGKMSIDKVLLDKRGPLLPAEKDQLRRYPFIGARAIEGIESLQDVAPIVAAHNERIDCVGTNLSPTSWSHPLEAKIVAIADVFDTMITGRSYRASRSVREAALELQRCAGTQFDPDLVVAFLDMLKYRGTSLCPAIAS